eukprot:gene6712-8032_t
MTIFTGGCEIITNHSVNAARGAGAYSGGAGSCDNPNSHITAIGSTCCLVRLGDDQDVYTHPQIGSRQLLQPPENTVENNADYQACLANPEDCLSLICENCNLVSTLPQGLGTLTHLTKLMLGNNLLTGQLPSELGQLTLLGTLYFDENSLASTVPTELGRLSPITKLYLYQNEFFGPIPTELGQLTKVKKLGLGNNYFTGTLPTELGAVTTYGSGTVGGLVVEDNAGLYGIIPSAIQDTQISFSGTNLSWATTDTPTASPTT